MTDGSAPRPRTVLSTIAGVLLLLLTPVPALPVYVEMQQASAHGHPISHPAIVLIGVLGTCWTLVTAVMLLRKTTTLRAMIGPAICGLATGLAGLVTQAPIILTAGSPSLRKEAGLMLSLTMIAGIAGVGHLLETRGVGARNVYIAGAVVPLLVAAAIIKSGW